VDLKNDREGVKLWDEIDKKTGDIKKVEKLLQDVPLLLTNSIYRIV